MRKLDRCAVGTPACIAAPPTGLRYGQLKMHEKQQIRSALLQMQGQRCAYCERRTGTERDEGHIEHFRDQAGHEHLDIIWSNMFWSCLDEKSCGKHKDKCDRPDGPQKTFDPAVVLDPCLDDPSDYIYFVDDGNVRHREGLNGQPLARAQETLRVFALDNHAFLRTSRADAVQQYRRTVEYLLDVSPDLIAGYVEQCLAEIDGAPFETAIRHYLESVKPE